MKKQAINAHILNYIQATPEELTLFNSKLNEVKVDKRKFLLQPGTYVKQEYFVLSGCLTAYYLDTKGHKHILQFAIENWWVGDFNAFYNHEASKLHIEALEDSCLFAISYKDLQALFIKAPIFERYFRILTTNAFIAQRKRILSTLEKNSKARYLEFCKNYPNIDERVPNYQIASYLGISAESISRIRRHIKQENI